MGYIKQLSEELIRKIAAGEVVERPASVVKELVENSIDANATKIEINIERGGKYIKVADNGTGIDPSDIDLLFTRHATSKLQCFEDLWGIESLGFRGEALASINAVSKLTCSSKHASQDYGFEAKVIDGKISKKSTSLAIGTIFEVSDLFYNVPARQKFLKSEVTELGHIYDVVLSLALSHPKISFTLIHNKNILLKSNGLADLKLTIEELLGNDLQKHLIVVNGRNHFLNLSGYISSLEVHKSDRKSIFIFINNRPIKCQIISKAIFSTYEGLLPTTRFPIVVLNLSFMPKFVDINVHPTKKEVRYIHPNDVYNIVSGLVQNAISDYYKKEYKEKSVYQFTEPSAPSTQHLALDTQHRINPAPQYSEAAFNLYSKPKDKESTELFYTNNLRCYLTHSNKPISNMTKIGNKTIFEVGSMFDDDLQIVFTGEVIGNKDYQKDFFNSLANLSNEIYKTYSNDADVIQKKIIGKGLEDEEYNEATRKKPPKALLYEVWERDNWRCVYCAKQLLDPEIVKVAMPNAKDAFVTYLKDGREVSSHILREHIASYDHHLPVSKLPQFNFDKDNLFACCLECNRKKSDSMELKSWKPIRQSKWEKPLEIAGLCFNSPMLLESNLKKT